MSSSTSQTPEAVAARWSNDEAEEVDDHEAEREGAESVAESIDTVAMLDSWRKARVLSADVAHPTELPKFHRCAQLLQEVHAKIEELRKLVHDANSSLPPPPPHTHAERSVSRGAVVGC